MKLVPLSDLAIGEEAAVVSVGGSHAMRTRLNDLGLVEGSRIRCMYPSAFGDPRAYLVRGATLGIRNSDAERILCRKGQENGRTHSSSMR